ncbi:ATP-binding protein [Pseudoalteromonas sp. OOF1S-7]|uniref:ATP-binding protein n=1 Tax=Pseudoalteromonas sp. OOF1S-7 TaxID=2917757 RepID=UPI001EF6F60D|nr:ATP-binding protein [Pseudoalteromonas sp. OOF1S-7]MCG7536463.1 ATP-binding protein [Pseudoalteromonas sp. OOF1S-7]
MIRILSAKQDKSTRWFAGVFSVFLLLLIALALFFFEHKLQNEVKFEVTSQLKKNTASIAEQFERRYRADLSYLHFLKDTPPFPGIARALKNNGVDPKDNQPIALWKTRIATIFKSLIHNNSQLLQLRIIMPDGREFVRVDRRRGKVERISEAKLQDKSHKDYVQETLDLAEEMLFASRVSLNFENNKVQRPFTPVLRIAMPLFDTDNDLFGLLVLNSSARQLIDLLESDSAEYYLTDHQGHYIYGPESLFHFTRDLAKPRLFDDDFQLHSTAEGRVDGAIKHGSQLMQVAIQQELNSGYQGPGHEMFITAIALPQKAAALLNERRVSSYMLLAVVTLVLLLFMGGIVLFYRNRERYQEDKAVYESIIDGADEPIVSFDTQLNVQTYNSASLLIFPSLAASERQHKITDLVALPMDRLQEAVAYFKHEDGPKDTDWYESYTLQDQTRHVNFTVSPVRGPDNQLVGITLFGRDTTKEKLSEQQVKSANEGLERLVQERTGELEAEKAKAVKASAVKSAFISTISHEMRTPLNGILGTLNLIRREPLTKKQLSYLEMTETSSSTLASLINDILDLSKIEAGKLELEQEPLNPISVVEHVVTSISLKAYEKQLSLVVDVTDIEFIELVGDAGRIKQVVFNLVSNAIKFTSKGGICVRGQTTQEAGKIFLSITVEDTGVGIDKNNHHKIFSAFTQEDSGISAEFGGTGLGLSICKNLCELMGGEIGFESQKNIGSKFYFTLPFALDTAKAKPHEQTLEGQSFELHVGDTRERSYLSHVISKYGGTVVERDGEFLVVDHDNPHIETLTESPMYERTIVLYSEFTHQSVAQGFLAKLVKPIRLGAFLSVFDQDAIAKMLKNQHQVLVPSIQCTEHNDLGGATVMIVDDNQINREVARGILQGIHANVVSYQSGHEALSALLNFEKNSQPVFAVLMDCNMPTMDGYQATRLIREGKGGESFRHLPVIAMTANAMSGERERCLAAGMDDYVTKPIQPKLLFDVLSKFKSYQQPDKPHLTPHAGNPSSQVATEHRTLAEVEQVSGLSGEVLDIDGTIARLQGDSELYLQICMLFYNKAPQKLLSLKEQCNKQAHAQVKQISHALRGQSGDIGAQRLTQLLAKLEEGAGREDGADYSVLIESIEAQYLVLEQVLQDEVFNTSSASKQSNES